eukprot:TRINITY_DN45567_c0_g1_i1.p1 TRINITY_DN45567_c0_g1~~TRINITY_DN45567_c0_g1_i1.p1  ORF type:complete len:262 (-),score=40.67 TRINITY_DN45567_c0_g1_i1:41-778(-)
MKRPATAPITEQQLNRRYVAPEKCSAPDSSTSVLNIYMCRHGTTHWNLAKKWQGEQDTELAPEGIAQAEETAKLLASEPLLKHCKCIFTSDLKRARHTAEIYGKQLGCDVVVEPRLREPSLGKFEGMTKSEIYSQFSDLFDRLAKMDRDARLLAPYFDGLESPMATSLRAEEAATEASLKFSQGDAVLFVTHSKVLEAVLAKVFGKFYEGIHTTPCAFFHWKHSTNAHELGKLQNIVCNEHQVEQ